jgi:hypothetical protein
MLFACVKAWESQMCSLGKFFWSGEIFKNSRIGHRATGPCNLRGGASAQGVPFGWSAAALEAEARTSRTQLFPLLSSHSSGDFSKATSAWWQLRTPAMTPWTFGAYRICPVGQAGSQCSQLSRFLKFCSPSETRPLGRHSVFEQGDGLGCSELWRHGGWGDR